MSNRLPSAFRNCRYCGQQFSGRGVTSHETQYCQQRPTQADSDSDDLDVKAGELQKCQLVTSDILTLLVSEPVSESWIQTGHTRLNRGEHNSGNEEITGFDSGDDTFNGLQWLLYLWYINASFNFKLDNFDEQQLDAARNSEDTRGDANQGLNDIKIVYHPSVEWQPDIYTFDYYCNAPELNTTVLHNLDSGTKPPGPNPDKRPWHPFPTWTDFELAEVMLDGHLNKEQIKRILSVFWTANPINHENNSEISDNRLTIQNAADLTHIWDHTIQTRITGIRNKLHSNTSVYL